MSDLRSKLIRLAYEKPEYREQLLPLVKVKTAGGKARAEVKALFGFIYVYFPATTLNHKHPKDTPFVIPKLVEDDYKKLERIVSRAVKAISSMKRVKVYGIDTEGPYGPTVRSRESEIFVRISIDDGAWSREEAKAIKLQEAEADIIKALESVGLAVTVI
jgi:hypothetical protein